jgi:hypothetical protein
MKNRKAYLKVYSLRWRKKNKRKIRLAYIKRSRHIVLQNKARRDERNKIMVKDFISGMSPLEIGRKYNINHERCRQIIIEYTGKKYKTYKQAFRGMRKKRLEKLTALCKKLNRIPYRKEVIKCGISYTTFYRLKPRFIAMGYKTTAQSKKEILMEDLKQIAVKLNRIPTARDMNESNHWARQYQYYFGTIKNAQLLVSKMLKESN